MKRKKLSWFTPVPALTAVAASYSWLAWGDGRSIGAVLAGAASIVTTVVVVSIFVIQTIRDSEEIRSIAQNTETILSKITQMETALKNSEAEKRILEENAQLHRDYLQAVAEIVQLMQKNQELQAQLNQEQKNNSDLSV